MRLFKRPLCFLILAFAASSGALAQSRHDGTVLPVWNIGNGKVEALLVLEPANNGKGSLPWGLGATKLSNTFGLTSGDALGLLCSNHGSTAALNNLASSCLLATLDGDGRQASTGIAFSRSGGRLGVQAGISRQSLSSQLPSLSARGSSARIDQTDLTVHGRKDIGREGFVSLAGTYAKARLVPLSDATPALAGNWDTKSLSVGGGYGSFSANVIGRVVDVPGQLGKWEGVGVGLTWRTPWSGQLTFGAENVVSRGKSPFTPKSSSEDEGTVPYVRYQQDL